MDILIREFIEENESDFTKDEKVKVKEILNQRMKLN